MGGVLLYVCLPFIKDYIYNVSGSNIQFNFSKIQQQQEKSFYFLNEYMYAYHVFLRFSRYYPWCTMEYYGVVVSMLDFYRSDRGSNPGRGGKIS